MVSCGFCVMQGLGMTSLGSVRVWCLLLVYIQISRGYKSAVLCLITTNPITIRDITNLTKQDMPSQAYGWNGNIEFDGRADPARDKALVPARITQFSKQYRIITQEGAVRDCPTQIRMKRPAKAIFPLLATGSVVGNPCRHSSGSPESP